MKRWLLLAVMLSLNSIAAQAQWALHATPPDSTHAAGAYMGPTNALVQGALAVTTCGDEGLPVTHYRPDVPLDTLLMAEITAHEMVHRAQMWPDSDGTCAQKEARIIASPWNLLNAEAPAYCAQIRVALSFLPPGTDDLPAYQRLVFVLTAYLNQHFTPTDSTVGPIQPGDVAHILFSYCKPNSVTYH